MKVQLSMQESESMGIFGFSWPEKVASFMNKQLKGTEVAKKLKSFWQSGGMNVSIVKNLHREYVALMASGRAPSNFSALPDSQGNGGTFDQGTIELAGLLGKKTNVESPIILAFLRALFALARDGKIPFAKWNPAGYKISTDLQKTFKTERGFLDTADKATSAVKLLSIVAAVGVSAYLLSQIKELRR